MQVNDRFEVDKEKLKEKEQKDKEKAKEGKNEEGGEEEPEAEIKHVKLLDFNTIFTDLVKFETVSRASLRQVSDWHLLQTCLKSLSCFEIVETVSRSSRRQYRTCSCARSSRASVHDRVTRASCCGQHG